LRRSAAFLSHQEGKEGRIDLIEHGVVAAVAGHRRRAQPTLHDKRLDAASAALEAVRATSREARRRAKRKSFLRPSLLPFLM
jgi:hypothetical protein